MKEQTVQQSSSFLKKFTLAILLTVQEQNFNIKPERKEIVDADLIPELTNELLREHELNKKLIEKLRGDKEAMRRTHHPAPTKRQPHTPSQATQSIQPPREEGETHGFEKIQPLLSDYSVSRIQCIAPNKPLLIVRTGQKQITKIILSPEEIKDIFKGIADLAHIPLIEGPFKASLKEYTINGINTRVANSRFIIQKQTAYSLLEKTKDDRII